MTHLRSIVMALLFAATYCLGQQTDPQAPSSNVIGHGAFPVKVTKTLDSSKMKEGDAVEVETAGSFKLADGTLIPKGSKLSGHVTTAKAKSKGDQESQLTLTFDKLSIATGKQVPVKGTVQAVFPPAEEADPGMPATSSHQGGPASAPAPDYKPSTDIRTGVDTQSAGHPQAAIDPKSVGVQGMNNLQLNDGVLSSKDKHVKLGSGVRMIVRVEILG